MRIHELAKELGVDGKAIISFLQGKGCSVKSTTSSVPDEFINELRSKYGEKNTQKGLSEKTAGTGGVKAVVLPESLLKMADKKTREKQSDSSEDAENRKSSGDPGSDGPAEEKKKKKVVGVFNPQYSQNKANASSADKNSDGRQEKAGRPLPSQVHPARDRKPDDYIPDTGNAAAEAGKDTDMKEPASAPAEAAVKDAGKVSVSDEKIEKAADEVKTAPAKKQTAAAETKHEDIPEQKTGEHAGKKAAEAKPDAGAKKTAEKPVPGTAASEGGTPVENKSEEIKNAAKDPGTTAQKGQTKKDESEKSQKSNTSGSANPSAAKTPDVRSGKESEAVQSLRAKIVKGTINPDDFLITTPKSSYNKNNGQKQGSRQNNNSSRTGGRNSSGSASRDGNRKTQTNGRFSTAGQAVRDGSSRSGSGSDRQNAQRGRETNKPSDNNGASASAQGSGRSKKQAAKPVKGRYDKNRGDKFDRLENEKAAQRSVKAAAAAEPEEEIKVITLPDTITVKDFSAKLKMQPAALIKKLFLQGKVFTLNDVLDFESAEEIALDMDIICEHEVQVDYIQELLKEDDDPEETLVKRPPVVCIMGHVDHGKTSLLDAIRKTNVTAGEAGGITQHIGAYTVDVNGRSITFLDTPGHEAFTSMRMRGVQATDVAILVVAADDGVMPQTIEAINHAKAANIHVIVAVNKIDKPGANIDKVKQELSDQGLVPEDWGGNTIFVPVSAKTGEGIDNLLEMVLLDTEILDLKANPNRMARGVVIEAKLDKGRGSVATLLVQKGTLKSGDYVAMGESHGKVRVMTDDKGKSIKAAAPSTPVEITGLNGVPLAGEVFVAFDNDKAAKNFAQVYIEENKKKLLAGSRSKMSLDDVFSQIKAGELKELDLIIKADLQGSVEALKESLEKLSNDEVVVKVIHSGAGNVTESDAILASASNAIIIAFNVDVNPAAKSTIEQEHVDLRRYSVIYNALDDVEAAIKGMLEPLKEEVIIGHAEIRQIFKASGIGLIAGSYVTDGVIKNTAGVRLSRDDEQIYEGAIASLKRFSDDAKEVRAGFECGVVLKDYQDIKEGDTMEIYETRVVPRE